MNSKESTVRDLLAAISVAAAAVLSAAPAIADPAPDRTCPICRPATAPEAAWVADLARILRRGPLP